MQAAAGRPSTALPGGPSVSRGSLQLARGQAEATDGARPPITVQTPPTPPQPSASSGESLPDEVAVVDSSLPPGPGHLARRLGEVEHLPTPPAVAMRVLELTRDDNCRVDQLVDVLQTDPALTAQLMRLANSSLFPGKAEVTSVVQASMKLGFRQLRLMSLSMSLLDEADDSPRSNFPHELYQRTSLCWSIGSQAIGDQLGMESSELFLCGLLAPMGHLILEACYPEIYGRLLIEARGELPSEGRELELLGIDAPIACAMLLERWELPITICESIRTLSGALFGPLSPQSTGMDELAIAQLTEKEIQVHDALQFGHLLARTLTSRRPEPYLGCLEDLAQRRMGKSGKELDDFLIGLEPLFRERADLLNITGIEEGWVLAALERARAEQRFESAAERATRDPQTGLARASTLRSRLERTLLERHLHTNDPLSLGLLRLELGEGLELSGPDAEPWLRWAGEVLGHHLRDVNDAAHIGLGVFAVLVPRASARMLRNLGERLVRELESRSDELTPDLRSKLRPSVGAACAADLSTDPRGQQLWGSTSHLLERARTTEGARVECLELTRPAA